MTTYIEKRTLYNFKIKKIEQTINRLKWIYFKDKLDRYKIKTINFIMNCDNISFFPSIDPNLESYYLIEASYTIENKFWETIQEQLSEIQIIDGLQQVFQIVEINIDKMIELINKCSILGVRTKSFSVDEIEPNIFDIKVKYIVYCNSTKMEDK